MCHTAARTSIRPSRSLTASSSSPQKGSWLRTSWAIKTADSRPVNIELEHSRGGFWNGRLALWRVGLGYRPSRHFAGAPFYEQFTASLDEGRFTKRLLRMQLTLGMTPDLVIQSQTQYDNVSKSLGFEVRLQWIIQPGNDFYILVRQDFDADGQGLRGTRTGGVGKLSWTLRF